MFVLNDYNHIVELMIGIDPQTLFLVPDTRLAETIAIDADCKLCMKTSGNPDWVPQESQKWNGKDEEWGTLDYFYLLHLFESKIGGNHF